MDELRRDFGGSDKAQRASGQRWSTEQETTEGAEESPDQPELYFSCADDWLHDWLFNAWEPPVGEAGFKWCSKWWLHPEAVHRIECLWRAWEHFRLDGLTGTSVWWRDHFDYHWTLLTGARGPFSQCSRTQHQNKAKPLTAIRTPVIMNDYVSDY